MIDEKEKAEMNDNKPFESDAVQVEPELSTEINNVSDLDGPPNDEVEPTDEAQNVSSPEEVVPEVNPEMDVVQESVQMENTKLEEKPDDAKEEDPDELHDEEEHHEEIDYSTFDKEKLQKAIAALSKEEDGYKKGKTLFAIRDAYDALFEEEKNEALNKFIADGGTEDDFDYKIDSISEKFEEYFKILKEKRTTYGKEQERQKDHNLAKKTDLLERLRAFIDNDENTESISSLKKLQEEWRSIGPVPHTQNRTLWANYNALMDLYYDHRSIYFELKELDRRKNLESKQGLCEQAEELDKLENLNDAIKKLNELHEEFKHLGPVPKEHQETTWNRFKEASDKVYIKRKDYFSHLKETFDENLKIKSALTEELAALKDFKSDSISEWNEKTKAVLEIQKRWEKAGSMPKENAKKINRQFWGCFKDFFKNKSEFFKTLDSKREENLKLKQALIAKANELKESEDWVSTANALKTIQQEWKEIGPVPEKMRDKVYKQFKTACDAFFNKKREHSKDMESSYDDNLAQKEAVCLKLEALVGVDDLQPEDVYALQDEFNNIGFVPKKAIKAIQNRYQSALSAIVKEANDFEQDEIDELKSLISINKIKSGPHGDQKLHRKEQALRRKIQNLESDISIWKNNIGFFANSKNANELMADFKQKIESADAELVELKEELKLITYAG